MPGKPTPSGSVAELSLVPSTTWAMPASTASMTSPAPAGVRSFADASTPPAAFRRTASTLAPPMSTPMAGPLFKLEQYGPLVAAVQCGGRPGPGQAGAVNGGLFVHRTLLGSERRPSVGVAALGRH